MIVIKYGGHALPLAGEKDSTLELVAEAHNSGQEIILVHGGGPQIDVELTIHGISTEMVSGYRSTTPEVFEIVQKVLSGQVLRTLVNQLIGFGANAVGLSAADGAIIRAIKMEPLVNGTPVNIGLVGDISSSDSTLLRLLVSNGYLPVVSPISVSESGLGLNLNADLAAGAIGGALRAEQVIFMTDVEGIYRNYPDRNSIMHETTATELRELAPTFTAGMIPKAKAALAALGAGAASVRIIDGRDSKNLESALMGTGGTLVLP